ncbi:MAG: DUF3127 domain-containing protein [Candidatus Marinimicrobia bacterium]|nr:DUF3127 domain-containing protein [Candidatus Neomarinimicrobiota bacterium]
MEITGKIIELMPEKTGQSANGPWRKQECILETDGQYPKKICFMVWGDKIDQFDIKQGDDLVVSIDLESREYNGRWYTDVKAWKVSQAGATTDNTPFTKTEEYHNTQPEGPPPLDDVIPF